MKVLIADDDPATRLALGEVMSRWGYATETCADGREALERLTADDPPRLAVLDWMMPGMDGVDICRHLQSAGGPFIYRLLLTGRNAREDLVHALENGAHDFQGKPVDAAELRARVAVGVRLIEADDQLKQYAVQMETLAEARAKQLVHAERLATLGLLAAGVAHEINNPLVFISGNAQILEKVWPDLEAALQLAQQQETGNPQRLDFLLKTLPNILRDIDRGVERVAEIVKSLKGFARKDEAHPRLYDLNECVTQALRLCHNALKHTVETETRLAEILPPLSGYASQVEQILVNLITNAVQAMGEKGGRLIVTTEAEADLVRARICDTGPGIPPDKQESIWEPFFTTKPANIGTGLGLSISRGIAEEHGGKLRAENLPTGGACFILELPLIRPEPAKSAAPGNGQLA